MPRYRRDHQEPEVESILRLAERADLLDYPDIQRLVTTATVTESALLKRQIEKVLSVKALQREAQPFDDLVSLHPATPKRVALGTTFTGSSYGLQRNNLTQHLLAIGQSGAGKTTLFYNLMDQLTVPFWCFDLKQDYRHLIHGRDDLLVLPWAALRFNPLKAPSGVPPRRWAQVFAEIFGHSTALLSGSKNYLMKKIVELYDIYGLFEEVSGPCPSMYELEVLVRHDPLNYVRKSANYRDVVLNRLEAMTLTAGTVFDCSEGFRVDDLLGQNVVFEFDGLGNDLQNFLMEILFAYVYEYRLATNQRGGELRHVLFLDEGKRVFSVYKERQDEAGLPEIDDLTAKMREFGEGLVVADQEASKLTDSIKANTYTKILLATGDAKQFEAMTESMHLSDRQVELAAKLGIGEAIIQAGNQEPVPVKLDTYDVEKTVTDEELQEQHGEHWTQLEFDPRQTIPAFEEAIHRDTTEEEKEANNTGINLSEEAERLLKDVAEHPFTPLTVRYDTLYSSRGKGDAPKNELIDKGIVVERRVKTGPTRKLLQLTQKGSDYVGQRDDLELKRRGRGGIVHQFWQKMIKNAFEELGWTAKRELFDADVYVMMDGVELVVEVAMGDKEREIEHVETHLDTFDRVWLACRSQNVKGGLAARLKDHGLLEKVTLKHCEDFLDLGKSEVDL